MTQQENNINNNSENYGVIVSENTGEITNNNYYNGMTALEASQLALTLFENNFPKLQQIAADIARERVNEMADNLFTQIALKCPDKFNSFSDPDIQYSLIEIEKSYARSGKDYLKNTLSSLLIHRVNSNSDFLSVCLNEAIKIVPSLTPALLDILSLKFIIGYTVDNNITNINILDQYISSNILPFIKEGKPTEKEKAHLTSFRCGQDSMETNGAFGIALANKYPKIFNVNYGGKDNFFDQEWPSLGSPEEYPEWKINDSGNIIDIKQFILNKIPNTIKIFNYYDEWLYSFSLTSLGKIIGAINAENTLKKKYNLSRWI